MVGGRDVVQVLNRPAFHDTQLVCSGDLAYLGGSWSKTVGCAVSSLTPYLILNSLQFPFYFIFLLICTLTYHIWSRYC